MINSSSSAKTTAFSLHYIFLFPFRKQWGGGGAKGHSPRIASSLNHSGKEQCCHRRGDRSHTARGPLYVVVPVPPTGHKCSPPNLHTRWKPSRQPWSTLHRWEAFTRMHTRRHRSRGAVQRTPTQT